VSHEDLSALVAEQAALRRVATMVARGTPPEEVFAAITQEVGRLLPVDFADMSRFDPDGAVTFVAAWGSTAAVFPVGSRWTPEGKNLCSIVAQTARPARIESYADASGPIDVAIRGTGIRSAVGTPIIVEGRVWGLMAAGSSRDEPMPADTETRLTQFTELLATAIANAESRGGLARLAEEQAALRRVATLVAQDVPSSELFAAVAREVGTLLAADFSGMIRYEDTATISAMATWAAVGEHPPVPDCWPIEADDAASMIAATRQPARVDDWTAVPGPMAAFIREQLGANSSVGCPIVVEGRLWGAVAVHSKQLAPLPPESESRLGQFTQLMATAIANTESHARADRLAEEQAALRRVATLVAEGASPTAVFDAVAAEMEGLLDADGVTVSRYQPDAEVTVLAHCGSNASRVPAGTRVRPEPNSVTATVRRTERPARMERYERAHGAIAQLVNILGVRVAVGAPIVVEGRIWGVVIAHWTGEESPPADTEARMAQFAQLLDTAIANADTSDQLTASRARLLTAADEARRRVVRDLHDGAQQRLVHTIVTLKLAQRALRKENGTAESLVGEALEHAERGNAELRELAHGILPAVLTRGGLRAGIDAVVARLDLPIQEDVSPVRLPAEIEASAYFIVAEALTNVVKHAHAAHAAVRASEQDGTLHVEIRDDGIGGADSDGHGLVGMADRVNALGGRLKIESPAGGGTVVTATLPLPAS
jgi:signal transduction histidine kinase